MTGAEPDLIEATRDRLAAVPGLALAAVFGSTVKDRVGPMSDVDIAVVVRPRLPLSAELDLQMDLERIWRRSVDLVDLDRASTILRWLVASTGRPIMTEGPAWVRFQARAASEHADFRPAFEDAAERYRRRIANPTGGERP